MARLNPRGRATYFIEGAVRLAAPPRARRAADSGGLNQAEPGGEQQGRQRAKGIARQAPQTSISQLGVTKPRRDLAVIQVWMIAAAGADELIHVVVAAFETAVHDAGRLAPQERRAAVAGPTSGPDSLDVIRPGAQPRVTAIIGASRGDSSRTVGRSGAGHDVKVAKTTHSPHRQRCRCRGLEQRYQQTITSTR